MAITLAELLDTHKEQKTLFEKIEEGCAEYAQQVADAQKILEQVKRRICTKYPLFYLVMKIFKEVPVKDDIFLETNGIQLFYQPRRLCLQYENRNLKEVEEQLLHILLHGILGHFKLRNQLKETELLDHIMDREVGTVLEQLGGQQRNHSNMLDSFPLDSRELYQMASDDVWLPWALNNEKWLWKMDDHQVWGWQEEKTSVGEGVAEDSEEDEGRNAGEIWEQLLQQFRDMGVLPMSTEILVRQLLGKSEDEAYGRHAGGRELSIQAKRESAISYKDALRELIKEKESYQEQDGTIDKILYTYGFEMYQNIALIEPEECSEIKQLDTLVIAIDTSGSCSGRVCESFLGETKALWRELAEVAKFQRIVLLQCDTQIQMEEIFTSIEELPNEDSYRMKGFGGTDFRPVFKRIEELKGEEACQIDGLFYLTDTHGEYPEKKPDYPVYFVIPEENRKNNMLQRNQKLDWITPIYLEKGTRYV